MLEIACFTASSAIAAAQHGADRIELCTNYSDGGVTPSISNLLDIRRQIDDAVPIYVMIRPRAGDFKYSCAEFEQMRHDVALFSTLASGFVFGILDTNGRVDVARNAELVDIAAPLPCTFHRAIDEVADMDQAADMVVGCGFKSVLTSGGKKTAEEGVERVKALQEKFGEKITLVIGGGIRSANVAGLKMRSGVKWVHSAAITGDGEELDEEEVGKLKTILAPEQNDVTNDQEMENSA